MDKVKMMNASGKAISFVVALFIVSSLCLVSTFAAYTSRSYVKGVAASSKQSMGLASDYLYVASKSLDASKYQFKAITLEKKAEGDETDYSIPLNISHLSSGSEASSIMQYVLRMDSLPDDAKVYLVLGGNLADVEITDKVKGGYEAPSMPAYSDVTHEYRIVIPKATLEGGLDAIAVSATPTLDSDKSGNKLAAKLQLSTISAIAGFSYHGSYLDEASGDAPKAFAAFNYEISVSNASEPHDMVLSWDLEKVEIDPFFLASLGKTSQEVSAIQSAGSLEIAMQTDVNELYLVKFYRKVGRSDDAWSDWDKVSISFEEKKS